MRQNRKASKSEKPQAIEPVDLSVEALNKQVKDIATSDPLLIYGAIGCVGLIVLALIGFMGIGNILLVGGIIGGLVAGWSWFKNMYLKKDDLISYYINERSDQLARENEEMIDELSKSLKREGCKSGEKQLVQLQGKFKSFEELLRTLLQADELTFTRFYGATQQVYHNALDNLKEVVARQMSLSDLYVDDAKEQLARLEKAGKGTTQAAHDFKKRISLHAKATQAIADLLEHNEHSMTIIDEMTVSLPDMKMRSAKEEIVYALEEVIELSKRVDRYRRTNI